MWAPPKQSKAENRAAQSLSSGKPVGQIEEPGIVECLSYNVPVIDSKEKKEKVTEPAPGPTPIGANGRQSKRILLCKQTMWPPTAKKTAYTSSSRIRPRPDHFHLFPELETGLIPQHWV